MATVRDTDLPDLLISLGYQVKRIGRYYTTQEMDSIRIKDRRTWFRYSEGIGGDAITFLQRFYNKSFPEAVEYLLTWHGRARDSPPVSTPRQTKEKEEKFPFITKINESWKHFWRNLKKPRSTYFWNISSCRKALCGTASWKF